MNIKYSTVREYLEGVKNYGKSTGKEWHVYHDDFFPHMTDQNEYWTGYYSVFPFFKKTVRNFEDYMHTAAWLSSLTSLGKDKVHFYREKVDKLMTVAAVNLHHDAITGTHLPVVE